jgi:hypothetical protein
VSPDPQLALPLESAPRVRDDDIKTLLSLLAGRGWLTARQIAALHAAQYPGEATWPDRYVRGIAAAADGKILSYPGSPGYRLTREASRAEIAAATASLRHQAKEMDHRADLIVWASPHPVPAQIPVSNDA